MKIPKHIKSRMMADAINQLPVLPENTGQRKQIENVGRILSKLYDDMD
jgi:hypothetical protein